jgi:hypothetical protein
MLFGGGQSSGKSLEAGVADATTGDDDPSSVGLEGEGQGGGTSLRAGLAEAATAASAVGPGGNC